MKERKTLFIIGNGFDLHHGLPTRYTDFIDFIETTYPSVYQWLHESVKGYALGYWDIIDKVDKGYVWNHMEDLLGSFEPMELLAEHINWQTSRDYKGPPSEEIQRLLHFGLHISGYLNAWLASLEQDLQALAPLKGVEDLLDRNRLVLSFNYTNTLEAVYGIEAVLHIHGRTGQPLIMGHGNGDCGKMHGDDFGINAVNAKYIRDYFLKTNKDTKKIIRANRLFFQKNNLTSVEEVCVLGHSLNAIDMPYIEKLLRLMKREVKWNLAYRQDEDMEYYGQVLTEMGIEASKITFVPWNSLK